MIKSNSSGNISKGLSQAIFCELRFVEEPDELGELLACVSLSKLYRFIRTTPIYKSLPLLAKAMKVLHSFLQFGRQMAIA
jgi:hypothetical protein